MEGTIEIIVKINDKKTLKAVLKKPLFLEYRMATLELMKTGQLDQLACGSSLVQHCWIGGDEALKGGDETKEPEIATAYASLCMDAYEELYKAFETEVKKN